jgi:hypothetical protein
MVNDIEPHGTPINQRKGPKAMVGLEEVGCRCTVPAWHKGCSNKGPTVKKG